MAAVILECDLGNSRFKWRLLENGAVLRRGTGCYQQDLSSLPSLQPPARIRVASVAANDVLDSFLRAVSGGVITPEIAESRPRVAGVVNGYGADSAKLGVDRWLALVAAYKRVGGAVLVLDAGSALTVDLVDADGRHLGGYIAPGERLMKLSLHSDTEKVRFDLSRSGADLGFGCATQQAVDAGVLAAQVGAVKVAIEEAGRRIPEGFAILVTGGGGDRLLPHLPGHPEYLPELVLDGLAWALP